MSAVIGKVAALFIMIAVGLIASKTKLLSKGSIPYLNSILLNIGTPAMILYSLYTRELSPGMMRETLLTLLFAAVYFIAMTALSYLFIRILRPEPADDRGTYICTMVANNTGFMGFPITLALFGNGILYYVVLQNIVLNVYCYMGEPLLMNIGSSGRTSPGSAVKSLFNVISACIMIGFVLMLTGTRPPAVIDEVIESLSRITVPVSMILVGIQLSTVELKKIFTRTNILCSLFCMFVIPAAYFLIIHPLPFLTGEIKTGLLFTAVMPSAVATMAIAEKYGKNSVAASEIISITSIISLFTMPAAALLLSHLYL